MSTEPPGWRAQFEAAQSAFRAAQDTVARNIQTGAVLGVEEYIELRRDSSGLRMLMALIQSVEGLVLKEGNEQEQEALAKLKQCTIDIMVLSWVGQANLFF